MQLSVPAQARPQEARTMSPEVEQMIRESVARHRCAARAERACFVVTGHISDSGRPTPRELTHEPEMAELWSRLWKEEEL